MAIDISIDLKTAKAHGKIEALRLSLASLDDTDMDFGDMDFDGLLEGLDGISHKLDDITDSTKKLNKSLKKLDNFQGIDTGFGGGGDTGSTSGAPGGGTDPPRRYSWLSSLLGRFGGQPRAGAGAVSGRGGAYSKISRIITPQGPGPDMGTRARRLTKMATATSKARTSMGKFGNVLKRLKPTMRKWWSLLALVIPLIITWGTAALGVASAMGAVAVAGAAVIGLGLAGHGDDIGSSFDAARERLMDFANDVFQVFQPAMQSFAPISDEFLDFAPPEMTGLADTISQLTVFKDTIFDAYSGFVDWLDRGFRGIVANEEAISQLTMRFGDLLGTGILNFFGFLLDYAYENQQLLIELSSALKTIGLTIIEVSEVVSRLTVVYKPLLDVLLTFARILNTPVIGTILSFALILGLIGGKIMGLVTRFLIMRAALSILGLTWTGVLGSMAAQATAYLGAIQAKIWATVTAMSALQKAMLATGIGALLVGGGILAAGIMDSMTPKGPPGRSAGSAVPSSNRPGSTVINNNYNNVEINSQGQLGNPTEQRMRSTIKRTQSEESSMSPPGNSSSGNSN